MQVKQEERKYWLVGNGWYIGPFDTATEVARHCKAHRINMAGCQLRYIPAGDVEAADRFMQAGAE